VITAQSRAISPMPVFIGAHATQSLLQSVDRMAAGDDKILITGETGVGKDLIARRVHVTSKRHARAFIPVNCAALTDALLESELFGHLRGSFTGADRERPGKLRTAHQGTVFLDEIGEMGPRMQAALLRFLESGEIQPVGSDTVSRVDARVIAATHRNLPGMVAAGSFRADLMYRLRVLEVAVPPLRERRADIPLLIDHFLARIAEPMIITQAARARLAQYAWPGNVRELEHVITCARWAASDTVIDIEHIEAALPSSELQPQQDRRQHLTNTLYAAVTTPGQSFWTHAYPLYRDRDLVRQDIRMLIQRGLIATHGQYRCVVRLFGMPDRDYKRFMGFLVSHGCHVPYGPFRRPGTPGCDV